MDLQLGLEVIGQWLSFFYDFAYIHHHNEFEINNQDVIEV